ncbi:hypothetical protein H257_17858 [Aphanomyces astaci]|uniref:Uncharacterized protein n=1 Tax=Aphanomyces astaci TaxID=112090 RepID=W4FD28_APHAT|nr:hypothetical protein H257_17858 [Aphanomyces astaci]ETV65397.1 hypothetical protein H257_17858 [Aphanomyces astaci]|eukprot:XP_009845112.1 hypothetical protein H257_17858 [Aphanomyces astaci]
MKNANLDPVRIASQVRRLDLHSKSVSKIAEGSREAVKPWTWARRTCTCTTLRPFPKHPAFKRSTKVERRTFMAAYNLCISQTTALTVNGTQPFVMPVNACIDPASKQRIADWEMGKDPYEVTEAEWVAWFRQGYDVDPRALDSLKKRIKAAIVFDMLDGLAAAIRCDRQEWVIKEESPAIVKIITDSVNPASLHRAVTEQMALTRNKPLKKDIYRFVRWLREYAIGHERFVGYEEDTKPDSPKTNQGGTHRLRTAPTQSTPRAPATATTPQASTTWADVSERLSEVQIYEPSCTGVPGYHRRGSSEAPQDTRTSHWPWTERR